MKKLLAVVLLAFATLASANDIDTKCKQHVIYGAPVKAEGNNQYLCRTAYAVNYNYSTKVAFYAVEHITVQNLTKIYNSTQPYTTLHKIWNTVPNLQNCSLYNYSQKP
jgi:DNA/RNA endonuclease G (NUC1)